MHLLLTGDDTVLITLWHGREVDQGIILTSSLIYSVSQKSEPLNILQ